MDGRGMPAVVVGVDVAENNWPAIRTGAWEAQRRGASLLLAHGYDDVLTFAAFGAEPYFPPGYDPAAEATESVQRLVDKVRVQFPDLSVHRRLWAGSGARGLVDESDSALLVVVGARGSGGFAGVTIGSTAAQVAAHAHCPVIVVRPPVGDEDDEPDVPHPGPVVVGVDGSPGGGAALRFAYDEASMRGVPVVAVNSWWLLPNRNLGPAHPGTYDDLERATDEAQRLLAEAVAGWSAEYPDVALEQRSLHEMNPSTALIDASRKAGLVVVGSRGRGGFVGLLLGSVGRDLVSNAHCPVAVVHPRVSGDE
jgi:nucleotide-binding universal stress UspA family protein